MNNKSYAEPMSDDPFDDPSEVWRPIVGFEVGFSAYEASSKGRILSRRRAVPRILKGSLDAKGYLLVCIRGDDNRSYFHTIHTLVLYAFVGPRPPGMEACHTDGNQWNNRPDNLRWDTHAANMADMKQSGQVAAFLNDADIAEIHRLRAAGWTEVALATKFNVHRFTLIRRAGSARAARRRDPGAYAPLMRAWSPQPKIEQADRDEIIRLKASGWSADTIAARFGISKRTVYRYLLRVQAEATAPA